VSGPGTSHASGRGHGRCAGQAPALVAEIQGNV
jgi:hypothetical protein